MNVLDLFAGPGGWDIAARQLGLDPLGIEWDDGACATRIAAGLRTEQADVSKLAPADYGPVDLLIASPPCQDFSMAGKRAGIDGDRGKLVREVLRWADALRPTFIACEQVPPVLEIWQHFAHVFRTWGYSAWTGVLNAADYGVPQTRQRAILVARRDGLPAAPPEPTHCKGGSEPTMFGDGLLPWVSMAQALGWGMSERPSITVTAGGGRQGGPDPLDGGSGARATLRRERDQGRWVLRNGSSANACLRSVEEPAGTMFFGHQLNDVSWYPDRSHEGVQVGVAEKAQGIRVTVEEAAALQSFPAGYPWQGSRTKQFEQIGNAVPPRLAAHVLAAVLGCQFEAAA